MKQVEDKNLYSKMILEKGDVIFGVDLSSCVCKATNVWKGR